MIHHLLTEAEPFSDITGGAISRWVANVTKSCSDSVVCVCADDSWEFDSQRVVVLREIEWLGMVRARAHRLPVWSQKMIISRILNPLVRLAREGDIVWVHNRPEYASVLSRLLANRRVQVVLHMHNSHLKTLDTRAWQLDLVTPVYCSHFLATEALHCRIPMKPGFVLYNGVDTKLFTPTPQSNCSTVEVAFSGRLVPEKGAHVLVEAMRLLHQEGLNARCTIIGSAGFGNSRTSEYVQSLRDSLPPNTEMAGYLSGNEYASRLRQADIFCCPSIWEEPFGMVIIEAMASGLAVVASSTGGIPEILQYGGGFLAEPSDPVFLAAKLKTLITIAQLRSQTRDEAIEAARKYFTWELIRQHYTKIASEIARCGDTQRILLPKTLASC